VALRLLHFADLHLDRSFASERLHVRGAQQHREELRRALIRVVERAQQAQVDLITCGGDLFEHDHVTKDTASFVIDTLGGAGLPVLIAPGHADPALASSPYRYLRWPANVTIATHEELRPYRYGDIQIWTAGFMRMDAPEAPLRDFARPDSGINLLLLHASDMSQVPSGVTPYKPILESQLQERGLRHALLGHYHAARSEGSLTYPGSPEPLGWKEPGPHCTALVTVREDGGVEVALEPINRRRFAEETIDVTDVRSSEELREAVTSLRDREQLAGGMVRVTLVGERGRGLRIDPEQLAVECQDGFAYLEFRDESRVTHDVDAVSREFTSRGEMVRKLVSPNGEPPARDQASGRALQLALDAFED
jgi:DNA repair protein SbcD/Mre11